MQFDDTPWTPFRVPPGRCRAVLITTAGVHLKSDAPFNMRDPAGDPTFRVIPAGARVDDLKITHNYYDHTDADRDINVVFPLERLRELVQEGEVGAMGARHFSFMGHILPPHIHTLMQRTAPEVVRMLQQDEVDLVLLTPA